MVDVNSYQCWDYVQSMTGAPWEHYDDVIMDWIASQITSLPFVCSIVYSGVNQRKHQSSASLAFVREIHRGPMNFPHKWLVTRKMFPFDDVIMAHWEREVELRVIFECEYREGWRTPNDSFQALGKKNNYKISGNISLCR